jgi:hypothetical protein
MSGVVTVPELLDGHTVLDIECLDRLYLNGYVPKLQVGGQVITFLHDHLGMPIVSPAVFEQIGTRFRRAVARFADSNGIPVIKFKKGIRKAAVMEPLLRRAAAAGRSRVVAIGWAQEFQLVWEARKRDTDPAKPPLVRTVLFGPARTGRFLAVVATPDRFGSCDGTAGTGGVAASREAGAVRAADRAGIQQPGGVPDRRDQPADRETVATRPHDHDQGRPEAALCCRGRRGGGQACQGDLGPVPV